MEVLGGLTCEQTCRPLSGLDVRAGEFTISHGSGLFLLVLFLLFSVLVVLVELRIQRYAYERMGISPRTAAWILVLTLVGSSINIPLAEFPPERMISGRVVRHFGMEYVVPMVHQWPATVLAINVGGALVPILLSVYLAFKSRIVVKSAIAIAAVAVVTHELAQPVPGVGVALPILFLRSS